MRTFTCPVHGDTFTDEGLPSFVKNCFCPRCLEEEPDHLDHERQYREAYRRWWYWQRYSGVPARGRNRTIANWHPQGRGQQLIHKAVTQYALRIRDHLQQGSGLTLLGPPGVGKTHLGYGLLAASFNAGVQGIYAVWPDVLDRHKATFSDRGSSDRQLLEDLKSIRFLVLDEIGVRSGSEFDQALLFDLIDSRYRHELPTVVISNLTEATLDSIGERTADRLREMNTLAPIPGESQRVNAASNRDLIDAPPAVREPERPTVEHRVCINGEMVTRTWQPSPPDNLR